MSPLQASLRALCPTQGGGWTAVGETNYPGIHIVRTEDATYRFVDGVCFAAARADGAPLPHAVGRRLVGWIVSRGGAIALVPSPHEAPARASFVLWREGGAADAFVVSAPTAETDLPAPRPAAPSGVQLKALSVRRPDPTSLTRIHTLAARSR